MAKTINLAKRGFAVLLSACMICGMTPLAAKAEETVSENVVSENMVSENTASGNVLTGIKYLDKNGKERICKSAVAVTAEDTTWGTHTDGSTFEEVWYVVNQDVTIDRRVTVADKVHLILMDGCTLTVNDGIEVQKIGGNFSNAELYIHAQSEKDSMGKLKAISDLDAATIGSEPGRGNGWIYFNGGDIEIENTGEGAAFGQGGEASDCAAGGNTSL